MASVPTRYGPFPYYEMGLRGMLVTLAHFLQNDYFEAQTLDNG